MCVINSKKLTASHTYSHQSTKQIHIYPTILMHMPTYGKYVYAIRNLAPVQAGHLSQVATFLVPQGCPAYTSADCTNKINQMP